MKKIRMIVKSTRRPINFGKFTLEWMLSPDPFCYFSLKLSFSTSPQTHYSTFAVSFFGSLSFASSFNWDVLLFIPLLSLEKNNHIYKYSQKFHLAPHIYLFRNREKILVDLWFHIDIRLQVGRYVVTMVQKRQLYLIRYVISSKNLWASDDSIFVNQSITYYKSILFPFCSISPSFCTAMKHGWKT